MGGGRTTLSFLDLALMLLSAFAYTHFVNIADEETKKKLAGEHAVATATVGNYGYTVEDFFGASNAMLTEFARKEIKEILTVQQKQMLIIQVPAVSENKIGQRLRQWEKIAARSAAIADAFEQAGQDGKMIALKMPERLVSKTDKMEGIRLTFMIAEAEKSIK
ncbi:MAG: hypothetical protein Pars2KO_00460 [Parasphingorhabdus sp.]